MNTAMNTVFSSGRVYRMALCVAVALTVTAVGGWGFVVSTAHAGGDHPAGSSVASLKIPLAHPVFGRPEPAVLVD